MKIYLAGEHEVKNGNLAEQYNNARNILESYYYLRKNATMLVLLSKFNSFLLDSGAFTYMQGNGGSVNWDRYIDEYADFILENKIDLFFELDIDSVVGFSKVLKLRDRLESRTGKQCIPVFHKSREKQGWFDMINSYKYVAIGGIVTKEIGRKEHPFFKWFIDTAHEKGVKVHGLGYTNLEGLKKYKFDSVDSTSWLYGNRSGHLYFFNGQTITKHPAPEGKRLKSRQVAVHNFNEWVKFANYAERNL